MLSNDFKDLLELLNRHEVRYLVAGGYATSIYAEPRYTKDLDLWVDGQPGNARRILVSVSGSLDFGASACKSPTSPEKIMSFNSATSQTA